MMIYAASKFLDQIKVRKDRHPEYQQEHYVYFETEAEAKAFIVRRARIKLENAQAALLRSRRHLAKVVKKFGEPCRHGVDDPEQCGLCDDERQSAAREQE